MTINKAEKKLYRAWSMYDWANSAYNLVITATIFPIYYLAISGDGDDSTLDYVSFFGWKVINSALLNYALAFAYLIIVFLSPILSSIADYEGNKKRFMQLFCYVGSGACVGMYFFYPGHLELGIILAILAAIGYCGSLVFYNAFLPEIAAVEYRDKLSAQGYAYGYIGSVILQLICFAFVMMTFEDSTFAPRLSFLLVGLWWFGFAQIAFHALPLGKPMPKDFTHSVLTNGFRELKKVWHQIQDMPFLKSYLTAFFFYSMGVQTVMLASAEFASKEIKKQVDGQWVNMEAKDLIITILLIQLVAILGAMLMARLSKIIGNIKVLMLTVLLWIAICAAAYFITTAMHFYLIAVMIGLVMGGIQSMSRSTYSKIMPPTKDTTSFFSFYDVTEKIAIVIGMFSFGFIEHVTGNMRNSIFALGGFFILGFFFLLVTNKKGKLAIS
ncbi:MAG: MFS transporter [Saprospiraceae bacterium]|uniref:MFS transporter n=1 Tax=Candidatus Opimibacter skivensis TaxID=2982028 RepID=A0A9D7XMN8_9BACT|nr:MFS transporter [Candidatus Opimibacter skivensis]